MTTPEQELAKITENVVEAEETQSVEDTENVVKSPIMIQLEKYTVSNDMVVNLENAKKFIEDNYRKAPKDVVLPIIDFNVADYFELTDKKAVTNVKDFWRRLAAEEAKIAKEEADIIKEQVKKAKELEKQAKDEAKESVKKAKALEKQAKNQVVVPEPKKVDDNPLESNIEAVWDGCVHINHYPELAFKLDMDGKQYTTQVIHKGKSLFPIISSKSEPTATSKSRDDELTKLILLQCGYDKSNKVDKATVVDIVGSLPNAIYTFKAEEKKRNDEAQDIRIQQQREAYAKAQEARTRKVVEIDTHLVDGIEKASITFRYEAKQFRADLAFDNNEICTVYTDTSDYNIVNVLDKLNTYLVNDKQIPEESSSKMLAHFRVACSSYKNAIQCLNEDFSKQYIHNSKLEMIKSEDVYAGIDENEKPTYFDVFVPENYVLKHQDGSKVGACGAVMYDEFEGRDCEPSYIKICDCKIMPTGYFTSYDSKNDLVELSFMAPDTSKGSVEKRSIIVEFDCIKSHKRFETEVIPKGVSVESSNIKSVLEYLTCCINANYNVAGSKILSGSTYDKLGWKDCKYTVFNSCERIYEVVDESFVVKPCLFVDMENTELPEKLVTAGTLEEEVMYTTDLMRYEGMHFIAFKTFDTLLIKLLGSQACTIGLEYDSSTGKTLSIQTAASMIGHPDKLLVPGDISVPALVARMRANHDHPLFVDDAINMKEETKKIISYIATNGREPDRSTNNGKLRGQKELYSNVFITSEIPIISDKAMAGADRRAIIIKKPIFPELDQKLIRNSLDGLRQNHGHILNLFLSKIQKYRYLIKGWYEQELEKLQAMTTDKGIKRQAVYYASAYVAGQLLEEIFTDVGMPVFNSHNVIEKFWIDCAINRTETIGDRALKVVHDLFTRSTNKNIVIGKNVMPSSKMLDVFGYYNDKYLDLNPEIIKQELARAGFDKIDPVFRDWRNRGLIKTNGGDAFVISVEHFVNSTGTKLKMGILRFDMRVVNTILNFNQTTLDDFDVLTEEEKNELEQSNKKNNISLSAKLGAMPSVTAQLQTPETATVNDTSILDDPW